MTQRRMAVFEEAADLYHAVRPGYPERLFDELLELMLYVAERRVVG